MSDEREQPQVPREFHAKLHVRAGELRQRSTPGEERLWQAISDRKLMGRKFRRQSPIAGYIVDFYCADERLVIEVDGPIHDKQQEADAHREQILMGMGLRVIRFKNDEVDKTLFAVLNQIRQQFNITSKE